MQAKGGVKRKVLQRGSIVEVHVPYHPGYPRYHDVTSWGLGAFATDLADAECDGDLVDPQVSASHDYGHAWKFGNLFQSGQEVTY